MASGISANFWGPLAIFCAGNIFWGDALYFRYFLAQEKNRRAVRRGDPASATIDDFPGSS